MAHKEQHGKEDSHTHGHDDSHDHSGHVHGAASGPLLRASLATTLVFVLGEATAGYYAHSLALLSDAGHNLSDALALGLATYAIWIAKKPANAQKTYGYHRVGILTALFNAVTLIVIAIFILVEAYHLFRAPQHVNGTLMLWVAAVALVMNTVIAYLLQGGAQESMNMRAAFIHMAGDALSSLAVVIAGFIVLKTGWPYADPVVSVLIAAFILFSSWGIVRDTDALLEVMVFLSRYYPKATIEKFTSEDLPRGHANNNLVVIGGPGSSDTISNEVCQEMMSSVSSHVAYSADCEKMLVNSDTGQVIEFQADLRTETPDSHQLDRFNIARDYGYFARFPNPLNESATVVLVNGIHTAGVLGAAKVFSDRRESLPNHHLLFNSQVNPKSFECHFEVGVVHGNVKIPAVHPQNVYSVGLIATLSLNAMSDEVQPANSDSRRNSVTILFIAGDRGGGQRNQIQIPRELDSIQNALRGCKYRDAMSLAMPILAATYEKLAEGYRHRPAILHFAGHGDDRSLSFISDQGLVVSETALVAERLSAILCMFPERIRLCVLNTCDSEAVAKYLVHNHAAESALGWSGKLADADAISFSGGFYGRLGDGLTLSQSVALATQTLASNNAPTLYTDDGIDRDVIYVRQKD